MSISLREISNSSAITLVKTEKNHHRHHKHHKSDQETKVAIEKSSNKSKSQSENINSNAQTIQKSPLKSPKNKLWTAVVSDDFKLPPPLPKKEEFDESLNNFSDSQDYEFFTMLHNFCL
jgi:hypothetical protein